MDEIIRNIAVFALPVLFAITAHAAAQGYVAKRFGDTSAFAAGRVTLNPLVHIDLVGTIIIPIALYLMTGFAFGYSKPVPLDFSRLRDPKRHMRWVALAGPGANFVMALIWLVLAVLLTAFGVSEEFPHKVAEAGVVTNLLFFAINLFPLPPLDGGRVVISLLPNKLAYQYARVEPYGFFILLALIYFKVLAMWIMPMMWLGEQGLKLFATPLTLLVA
ncbi:MAG: site-2 protease family protein [Telluria sp.]